MLDIPLMPSYNRSSSSSKHRKAVFRKHRKICMAAGICLLLLLIWLYSLRQEKRYVQHVEYVFQEQVSPIIEEMQSISGPDLSFIPDSFEEISFHTKENPETYILHLRREFSQEIDVFKKNNDLRVEIDISHMLASMSTQDKIHQLFMFGVSGITLGFDDAEFLLNQEPGGIIIMGKNISDGLLGFIQEMHSMNKLIPLFIAIDQEGGPVTRIPESLPGQAETTIDTICATYTQRDSLLAQQGINMNFGIVADTNAATGSYIASRIFDGNVEEKVAAAVHCTSDTFSTLKHFPGHGAVRGDTHIGTQPISLSCDEMKRTHFLPFLSGITAGADAVMMGHLVLPCLDPSLPASLSHSHIEKLRQRGFTGLIVTDDMDMLDNDYTWKNSLELALKAGNDIILYVEDTAKRKEILTHARFLYDRGVISEDELNTRVSRILTKKNEYIRGSTYVPYSLYLWE